MSTRSRIEWTEVTWNPTTGCDRISAGCDHCYALTLARRLKAMGSAKYQNDGDPRTSGPGFGVTVHEQALTAPLRWREPSARRGRAASSGSPPSAARRAGTGRRPHAPRECLRLHQAERRAAPQAPPRTSKESLDTRPNAPVRWKRAVRGRRC